LGVILISAQQFMSAVHGRVTGNAATLVVGRSGSAELAAPAYRFLDQDVRGNLTRLSKGELLLSHSIYRQPVKIIFPKPAFKQQGVMLVSAVEGSVDRASTVRPPSIE